MYLEKIDPVIDDAKWNPLIRSLAGDGFRLSLVNYDHKEIVNQLYKRVISQYNVETVIFSAVDNTFSDFINLYQSLSVGSILIVRDFHLILSEGSFYPSFNIQRDLLARQEKKLVLCYRGINTTNLIHEYLPDLFSFKSHTAELFWSDDRLTKFDPILDNAIVFSSFSSYLQTSPLKEVASSSASLAGSLFEKEKSKKISGLNFSNVYVNWRFLQTELFQAGKFKEIYDWTLLLCAQIEGNNLRGHYIDILIDRLKVLVFLDESALFDETVKEAEAFIEKNKNNSSHTRAYLSETHKSIVELISLNNALNKDASLSIEFGTITPRFTYLDFVKYLSNINDQEVVISENISKYFASPKQNEWGFESEIFSLLFLDTLILLKNGFYHDASSVLETVLKAENSIYYRNEYLCLRSVADLRLGENDMVFKTLLKVIRSSNNFFDTNHHFIAPYYFEYGKCYFTSGDYKKAIKYFRKARHIYATNFSPKHRLTKVMDRNIKVLEGFAL